MTSLPAQIGHNGRMTQVWSSPADVPAGWGPTVVTVGNFDGVHRGHQAVLERVVAAAEVHHATSVAVTFDPHPKSVHDPDHQPQLIAGLADRVDRIAACGIDAVVVQHYTLQFAQATPREFVKDYLIDGLGAVAVVVGRDTRFGRGNAGDVETLREIGEELGLAVHVLSDVAADGPGGRRWSSTWVREALESGDLEAARAVLGRHHRLRGPVVHGDARGRDIGFPTANLGDPQGYIPRHGVYAGWLEVTDASDCPPAAGLVGERFPAAISIGINYTVGSQELRVEAHVLDRTDLHLYGAEVALDLVEWSRPMLDFGTMDALIDALRDDVAWSRGVLNLR